MHDRNGLPLAVGDSVLLEGVITQAYDGAETCQLTVAFTVPQTDTPGRVDSTSCNARQVLRIPRPLTAEDLAACAQFEAEEQLTAADHGALDAPVKDDPAFRQTVSDIVDHTAGEGPADTGTQGDPPPPDVAAAPERCDCPALGVPHVHAQGGPEPITD